MKRSIFILVLSLAFLGSSYYVKQTFNLTPSKIAKSDSTGQNLSSSSYEENDLVVITDTVSVSSNVTLTVGKMHLVNTSSIRTLTLPAPSAGAHIYVKDHTGNAATNTMTITKGAGVKIDNEDVDTLMAVNHACCHFWSDGSNWFIISCEPEN